jgi:hypothetical protein
MAGSSLPSLAHGRVPPLRSVPRGICEIHRRSLAPLSRLGQHCVAQSTSPATFRSSAPSHFTLDADGVRRSPWARPLVRTAIPPYPSSPSSLPPGRMRCVMKSRDSRSIVYIRRAITRVEPDGDSVRRLGHLWCCSSLPPQDCSA